MNSKFKAGDLVVIGDRPRSSSYMLLPGSIGLVIREQTPTSSMLFANRPEAGNQLYRVLVGKEEVIVYECGLTKVSESNEL